jgi:hypothetical protein
MAQALEAAVRPASAEAVADWIQALASESLRARAEQIRLAESESVSPVEARAGRDTSGPGASDLLTIARRAALKVGALAAGVFMVWFGVEQLWPRVAPPVSPGGGAATAVPPAAVRQASVRAASTTNVLAVTPLAAGVARADAGAARERTTGARVPVRALEATPRPAPRGAEPADCTPPFSLDAQGIRHMKPGCR